MMAPTPIANDPANNKYKNSISFSFYDNTFEPLMLNDSFIWKYEKPENLTDEEKIKSKNLFLKLMTVNYNTMIALDISLLKISSHFMVLILSR